MSRGRATGWHPFTARTFHRIGDRTVIARRVIRQFDADEYRTSAAPAPCKDIADRLTSPDGKASYAW